MKKNGQYGGQYYLYRSIISILVGVILLAFPEVSLTYLVYAVGVFTIIMGLVTVIALNKSKEQLDSTQRTMMSTNGIINIALGVVLLVAPSFFLGFLMFFIGGFITAAGALQLFLLWQKKRVEKELSLILFVMPLIIITAGLLVIFNPFQAMVTTITIMGIVALFYGISELIIRIRIQKIENNE